MSLKIFRWFHRRGLSRAKMKGGRLHRWVGRHFFAPELWRFQRDHVATAWLVGILVCSSPFFGMHLFAAVLLAMVFRANIPLTMALQFLTNPVTVPFYYTSAFVLGCWILGRSPSSYEGWRQIIEKGWWPLLVGCTTIGVMVGGGGWLLLKAFWPAKTLPVNGGGGPPGTGHSGRIPAL